MAITRETLTLQRLLMVSVGVQVDDVTRNLTYAWTRSWTELHRVWTRALQDAAERQAQTGVWPRPWEQARLLRLQQALGDTQAALVQLGTRAGVLITDEANNVIESTINYEPRLIASQLPAAEQVAAATRFAGNIVPSALDAIVARTQANIVSLTQPLSAQAMDAMRRELIKGIAVGDNPETVAKAMLDRVQGAFEGGLTRANVIARTEMLDAHRAAAMHTHAANADVLAGWVWLAQLDDRCCPSCWSMHGKVFPVNQPGPWDHQQGRCARVPKTKSWRELGIDIDEPADTIPDAQAKFWGMKAADRQAIMGPRRHELLRSGRIQFKDLAQQRGAAGWRPSYNARAVKDLDRLAAQRKAAGIKPVRHPLAPKSPYKPSGKRGAPTAPPKPKLTPAQQFDARLATAKTKDDALNAVKIQTGHQQPPFYTPALSPKPAGWTDDQLLAARDAFGNYQANGYRPINSLLRGLPVSDTGRVQAAADLIKQVMGESTLRSDALVYRGFPRGQETITMMGGRWSNDMTGTALTEKGFFSTSADRYISMGFSGQGPNSVLLRIILPKGTKSVHITGGESEILTHNGIKLRIIRDRGMVNGRRELDVEVIK